jgi:dihydropyrimidinase
MHIDFALPVTGDLEEGFKEWQRKAERSVMDYSFHMAITTWNEVCRAHRFQMIWRCWRPRA